MTEISGNSHFRTLASFKNADKVDMDERMSDILTLVRWFLPTQQWSFKENLILYYNKCFQEHCWRMLVTFLDYSSLHDTSTA